VGIVQISAGKGLLYATTDLKVIYTVWGEEAMYLIHSFIHQWLYILFWTLAAFFAFIIRHTVGKTPWTGDQPVTRPLPTHRTTQTQNRCTQTHPWLEWDSNPGPQCLSGRRLFLLQTEQPPWPALCLMVVNINGVLRSSIHLRYPAHIRFNFQHDFTDLTSKYINIFWLPVL
jgi:hypothetical protein